MAGQTTPFSLLTDIAERNRAMAAGLPEQQEAVELWNGIGFILAGERYVAPMGEVTEILHVPRFTHIPGVQPFMMGAANVRGRLLPLVDLANFFGLARSSRNLRKRRVLIVEQGDVRQIFNSPSHPYTEALINSVPKMEGKTEERLYSIPGQPPPLWDLPEGCSFAPRCPYVHDRCTESPPLVEVDNGQMAACWLRTDGKQG